MPFQQVVLADSFWLPRLQLQKDVLVPFALDKVRPAMDNLRKTGNYLHGIKDELPFPHRFGHIPKGSAAASASVPQS